MENISISYEATEKLAIETLLEMEGFYGERSGFALAQALAQRIDEGPHAGMALAAEMINGLMYSSSPGGKILSDLSEDEFKQILREVFASVATVVVAAYKPDMAIAMIEARAAAEKAESD